MYPAHGLALFPPFPRNNRVFVAMSFAHEFQHRWEAVIAPGITVAGLEPFRIDMPRVSGSIPAEIVAAIAESRLVLADVTAVAGQRNGNVMYEVGIAHAARQPEEVLLFRSDDERLLFDVATIRVNRYEPDRETDQSRDLVAAAVRSALADIETMHSLAVTRAGAALDSVAINVLIAASNPEADGLTHPSLSNMAEHLARAPTIAAISRLLELELLSAEWPRLTAAHVPEFDGVPFAEILRRVVRYRVTPLGEAVLKKVVDNLGMGELATEMGWDRDEPRG
jgi:hypothetical protein